jgi:hypothetical protein
MDRHIVIVSYRYRVLLVIKDPEVRSCLPRTLVVTPSSPSCPRLAIPVIVVVVVIVAWLSQSQLSASISHLE